MSWSPGKLYVLWSDGPDSCSWLHIFIGEEKGIDDPQVIEHSCSYALYLLSKHITGSNWEIMSRSVDWKAKSNICTLTSETAWKTWERITNIYHVANEVLQKILAQFLKR